jgi:hypothetical protein
MALQSAFTLTANEIYDTLANMIISQQVFADNLSKHQTLVDKARVDGSMYGDTKLYYATDVLKSVAWGNDAEAANLLALDRAEDPEVQAIKLDVFRQIRLTVDNYLTKRAFADEGTFASFNGVMLGWMQETKKVYDGTLYNVFIGTTESNVGKQQVTIDIDADNNSAGENIAKAMADLFTDMADYNRAYNDYGFLRSYGDSEIKVIWNADYFNQVKKIDLPSIFHDDALQSTFAGDVLAPRYFGTVINASNISDYSASTPTTGKPIDSDNGAYTPGANHANGTLRAVIEKDVTVGGVEYHVFPGDEIPSGATVLATSGNFGYGEVYIETADVICKVLVKYPPYMSAFETGTTFFNPRSLTENHYLTFCNNTLQYLKNYPFITVKAI